MFWKRNNDCFLYLVLQTNSDTYSIILVTPFPQGSYGLNSDKKLKSSPKRSLRSDGNISVRTGLSRGLGSVSLICSQNPKKMNTPFCSVEKKKLADIVHAASFGLAKLEILESQLSNDKSKECKTILEHVLSAKQEQHLLMTNLTKQILVLDKHITDMRTAFKYQHFT